MSIQGVELSDEKTMFFHVENRTFQVASGTAGQFPETASWYEAFAAPSPMRLLPHQGRRKGPLASSSTSLLSMLSPIPSHSVIFCTWLNHGDSFISPELFRYFLPPEEKISSLDLKDIIFNLELDLQTFVVVAGRYFLLGYDDGSEAEDNTPNPDAVYNVCVEITAQVVSQ